jgi:hypothetical protein
MLLQIQESAKVELETQECHRTLKINLVVLAMV